MTMSVHSPSVGQTQLVLRMADVLAAKDAPYPMAGALSAAVRGRQSLSRCECAGEFGLTLDQIDAAESGYLPVHQLPEQIFTRIPWLGLDLTALPSDSELRDSLSFGRRH